MVHDKSARTAQFEPQSETSSKIILVNPAISNAKRQENVNLGSKGGQSSEADEELSMKKVNRRYDDEEIDLGE